MEAFPSFGVGTKISRCDRSMSAFGGKADIYADVLRCPLLTAFAALFVSSFAVAQAPQTVRVRGTIEKVDGQTLTVKLRRLQRLRGC